ncbi:MAG: hypothetical protein ACKV2Q_28455 [Planctomycetaceae bacterium]
MKKQRRRFWRISLYKHGNDEVVAEIPTTHITERRVIALLKMLYAKHWLTNEEIVVSHLRGNVKRHRSMMSVDEFRSQDPISFWIHNGSGSVHAIVVRPEDQEASQTSE